MAEQHDIGGGRDLVIAAALQQHLDARADDTRLLARIRQMVGMTRPETGFDVLSSWLRPGLAAAAAIALGVLFWNAYVQPPAPVEAALAPSAESLLSAALGTPDPR
jgi:hypothetical protein